ncbi:hypothetical protein NPIL_385251 [Nephila pilipes]|uniref:Uncharacterized protein n=1 Tax=Nephila pilipes TaxID=299642 RepID=A0A8X6UH10_NEPPI|nr:hypothetical protein NPIL_385251 [Nephila pilipes]
MLPFLVAKGGGVKNHGSPTDETKRSGNSDTQGGGEQSKLVRIKNLRIRHRRSVQFLLTLPGPVHGLVPMRVRSADTDINCSGS